MIWTWIALLIILAILFYLWRSSKISGVAFFVIILLFIAFFIILLAVLGGGIASLIKNVCLNKNCDVVRLPYDITKIGEYGSNNNVYKLSPLNNM